MADRHIDLSEELEEQIGEKYKSFTEEVQEGINTLYEALSEICQRTQYLPFVTVVNEAIEQFDGEVKGISQRAFEEWMDGDACFRAAAEHSEAGDDAIGIGTEFDKRLSDIFEEFWTGNSFNSNNLIQVDTSRPRPEDQDFDDMKQAFATCHENMGELQTQTEAEITSEGDDNPTYALLAPAVIALIAPIVNAMDGFASRIDAFKDESNAKTQEQAQKKEDASESATNSAVDASDIAEALNMFAM